MKNNLLRLLLLLFFSIPVSSVAATLNRTVRQQVGETLTRIIAREVAKGDVRVKSIQATRSRVRIYASVGLSYYPFREDNVRAMYDSVRTVLPRNYAKARMEIYTNRQEISNLIPLAFRKSNAQKKKAPITFVNRAKTPLITPLSKVHRPTQGLTGRHIALWQSHGRYFDQEKNCWRWQRSQLWETREDLYTQSYVLPYLVPMLENAGACVLLPRERDIQKYEILSDNDQPEQYREKGSWQTGGVGFAHTQKVYRTGENPFRTGTTRYTTTITDGSEAYAVWSADIPEQGEYAIYVSYESSAENTEDARYTIRHLGGESRFSVNQSMGGGTWLYLGTFLFAKGPQDIVMLTNKSSKMGQRISADAVKIGGGYGNIVRSTCDSLRKPDVTYFEETSGYPRFCEGARYWLQWAGFDEKVYAPKEHKIDYKEDIMSRAHWVNTLLGGSERLPDSVGLRIPIDMTLAFHSDAGVRGGDTIVGTLGIYCTRDNRGHFVGGASRYRSRDLTDLVMSQIVNDIRRNFEPNWNRRGMWNKSYYEARVPAVPSMLLELLSHQNFSDMRYGNDPRFKFTVSRAVYKGILRYISSQYKLPYVVQPLPVEVFGAEFIAGDSIRLRWTPVLDSLENSATPTGYVVYTRIGDGGFDTGRYVDTPFFTTTQKSGIIYSYRVTAVNAGGESFPSEILSACRHPQERGRVLIVNGFDRVCAPHSMQRDSLVGFYNEIDEGVPDRRDICFTGTQRVFDLSQASCNDAARALGACDSIYETDVIGGNTFDYPYIHGKAVVAAGYSFCSTSAKSLERGEVHGDYTVVDLILGKQRATIVGRGTRGVEFRAFTPALQQGIRQMVNKGAALFVSGCYGISDLLQNSDSSDADRSFATEILHCTYDTLQPLHRNKMRVVAPATGFSRGEYLFYDFPDKDHYAIRSADRLRPVGSAFAVMRYVADNRIAAVASKEDRTFVMTIPFEALTQIRQQEQLMREILSFLDNKR